MLYSGGVIIPMSFTTAYNCSFSVEPIFGVESNPTYSYQDGKIVVTKVNYELKTTYEYEIELFEKVEFNLYKMCLLTAEIASSFALLFVVKKHPSKMRVWQLSVSRRIILMILMIFKMKSKSDLRAILDEIKETRYCYR